MLWSDHIGCRAGAATLPAWLQWHEQCVITQQTPSVCLTGCWLGVLEVTIVPVLCCMQQRCWLVLSH